MVHYTNLLYVLLILWTEVMHSIGDNVSWADRLAKVVGNALHRHTFIHCFCSYWTCIYLVRKCKPQGDCGKEHFDANDKVLIASGHRANSYLYITVVRIYWIDSTNFLKNCQQKTCNKIQAYLVTDVCK